MEVGSKLLYEELQIKFDFRHSRPTFFLSYCPLSHPLMDPYFNLLGSVGDLYCFSNTLSMRVDIILKIYNIKKSFCNIKKSFSNIKKKIYIF